MKLYEIAQIHNKALEEMEAMDNIPEEVIKDTMESLEGDFKDKALSVSSYFLNIEADINSLKEAEKRLSERRKNKERQVYWLKAYLAENMLKTGISAIECPYFKLSLRDNPASVVIHDESLVPDRFKTEEVSVKINKQAIKAEGGCPGASLVKGKSVVIK